jgi:hypothetical protein
LDGDIWLIIPSKESVLIPKEPEVILRWETLSKTEVDSKSV